jgi:hypothetical protein
MNKQTLNYSLWASAIVVTWNLWYLWALKRQPYCRQCFKDQSPISNFSNRHFNEGFGTYFLCSECECNNRKIIDDNSDILNKIKKEEEILKRVLELKEKGYTEHLYPEDHIRKIKKYKLIETFFKNSLNNDESDYSEPDRLIKYANIMYYPPYSPYN